ncbi:20604_t:CDS:1, partial [Gigaspora margarita]
FTEEGMEAFEILIALFGSNVTNYTTIVRSKFDDFDDTKKCKTDIKALVRENRKLKYLVNSCKKMIHIDAPSINNSKTREYAEYARNSCRNKLLEFLNSCQGSYKVKHWDDICVRIIDFMNAREKLRKKWPNILIEIRPGLKKITDK